LAGEREALDQLLQYQRATLQLKCAGLTEAQLKQRAVPPSGLTLLGLVRHMTDVERWWFRMHAAGEDLAFVHTKDEHPEADFEALDEANAEADLRGYDDECRAADLAVATKQLDDVVASRGDHPERTRSIRWIYLHMIEEYARHNGHADLLRECIDGATGD
jgi:uncharacterized damage-inducible protein DinB